MDTADGFDPTTNSNCGLGLSLVYDPILKLNYDTNEVMPNLATSFGFTDDLTFTLTMRDDVTFSNGAKMTPDDVVYSLSRFVFENSQFETGYDNIDFDATTINGNTITLKLKEPAPDLPYYLSNDRWASVICKDYVQSSGADAFWDKPVGTGPYTCTENVAGSHATYARKDSYWGVMPQATTVTVRYYSEPTTMMVDFENNELDIAMNVGEADYNTAKSGGYGDTVAKIFPTYDILAVTMPQYMAVFNDIRVRQAVAYALDSKGITQAVFGSLGTVADSCLMPGVEYYTPIRTNEYDPDKAKELLSEAGFKPGDLKLLMLFPGMPTNVMAGTIVQSQLAAVGIDLTVESGDFATIIPRLMNNECELSLYGTGGGTTVTSRLMMLLSATGTNAAVAIKDADFNALINKANTSTDDAVRAQAYKDAQQWVADNYWYVPISFPQGAVLYHSNIDNVTGMTARSLNLCYATFN